MNIKLQQVFLWDNTTRTISLLEPGGLPQGKSLEWPGKPQGQNNAHSELTCKVFLNI